MCLGLEFDLATSESVEERLGRIESELLWRRTDIIECGRVSLYQHLRNTVEVLQAWRQPPPVVLAGALHCVHAPCNSESYRSLDLSDEIAEDLVGSEGNRILAIFRTVTLDELLASVTLEPGSQVRRIAKPNPTLQLAVGDLAVIHMAIQAQSCAANGSPSLGLATSSRLAQIARQQAQVSPPVFDDDIVISSADEELLLAEYDALLRCELGAHQSRLASLASVAEKVRWVAEPFALLGLFCLTSGDCERAAAYGARALALLKSWNTCWDKRISALHWLGISSLLRDAAHLETAEAEFLGRQIRSVLSNTSLPDGLCAQLEALGILGEARIISPSSTPETLDVDSDDDWSEFQILPDRFSLYIAGFRDNNDAPLMGFYPGLTARPWWDAREFGEALKIEADFEDIVAEYSNLESTGFRPAGDRIRHTGSWEIYTLFENGQRNIAHCNQCPKTAALVEACWGTANAGLNAYFTRLGPMSRTAKRRVPQNTRLSVRLGLRTNAQSVICVSGVPERTRERRCLVVDESFDHEEWNEGATPFVMFVVDIRHPDLKPDEIRLLEGFHRTIIANAAAIARG